MTTPIERVREVARTRNMCAPYGATSFSEMADALCSDLEAVATLAEQATQAAGSREAIARAVGNAITRCRLRPHDDEEHVASVAADVIIEMLTAAPEPAVDQQARNLMEITRQRNAAYEAIDQAMLWHEAQDKAVSKQPPGADREWRRMQHNEQLEALRAALALRPADGRSFHLGDRVEKIGGASWRGIVVGSYSTSLTPEGYAVESDNEPGSVQIYPAKALRTAIASAEGGA